MSRSSTSEPGGQWFRALRNRLSRMECSACTTSVAGQCSGDTNHLRADMKTLEQQGGSYAPHYLSQIEFDAIANSPMETGR